MYVQTLDNLVINQIDQVNQTGMTFLKDKNFWSRAEKFPFVGDALEIEKNRQILSEIKNIYKKSNQYKYGLGEDATTPLAWLTYQFMHANFIHLCMNMIFLLLVTNILTDHVRAGWILSVYILGGIGAGIFYLFSGQNEISMVGASGSLCALISFLCTLLNTKNIQWSYFLSPFKNGYGLIYMPAFLLFPIYLMSDFTTALYHSNGVHQSVAHSAHIGGAVTGFLLGLGYLFWGKSSAHRVFSDNDGLHELL